MSTLVDRRGEGSPIKRTSLRTYLVVSAPSAGISEVRKAKNIPLRNKERVHEMLSPLPPLSYLGRHQRHSHDKIYQAFPLHFCILQAIKKKMGDGIAWERGYMIHNVLFHCFTATAGTFPLSVMSLYIFFNCPSQATTWRRVTS